MKISSYQVPKTDVLNYQLPLETDSYKPVPHALIIQMLTNTLKNKGHDLRNEVYNSAMTGDVVQGRFLVDGTHHEMGMEIQFLNSYNKSTTLSIAMGGHVFICTNGCVAGEYTFKRKHTGDIIEDLNLFINNSVESLYTNYKSSLELMDVLKQIQINERQRAELIGRMLLEQQFITVTQVGLIEKAHEQTSFKDNTMWSLYNNVTQAFKTTHPSKAIGVHTALTEFTKSFIEEIESIHLKDIDEVPIFDSATDTWL